MKQSKILKLLTPTPRSIRCLRLPFKNPFIIKTLTMWVAGVSTLFGVRTPFVVFDSLILCVEKRQKDDQGAKTAPKTGSRHIPVCDY